VTPRNAAGALHTQLSRRRRLLGGGIATEANGYRLTGAATDINEFEQLAAQTEAASREDAPAAVRDRADAAFALWRGPAELERHDFAQATLIRLTARRETVAALRAEARLEGPEAVLAELAAAHAADRMNEPRAARYMRALAATGRQSEALAVYDQVRAQLVDELGVDPSAMLQAARLDVLKASNRLRRHRTRTACRGP
jgi:DNA-binding SARP family transcriptional activator